MAHTYDIPGAIYDPSSQFNLLGIPKLADFFRDKDYLPGDDVDSNGTTVKSSGCRSCLIWDHGKHTHNFTHGDSNLPEIMLYQGHGYFDAFCTRLWHCYDNGVAFANSSAFSISPSHVNVAAIVSDGEDLDEEKTNPTVSTARGTQNNGHDSSEEEVEWFSPPPPPSVLPLPPSLPRIPSPITLFKLGMSLSFYDGTGQAETVVYKGVMPDGLIYTVRRPKAGRHTSQCP